MTRGGIRIGAASVIAMAVTLNVIAGQAALARTGGGARPFGVGAASIGAAGVIPARSRPTMYEFSLGT